MLRNLLLTGGWAHDFAATAPVLVDVLAAAGVDSTVVDDVDAVPGSLDGARYDLLTVYACWFRMLDARYTDEQRATWARTTPPETRRALAAHLDAGGGLLALHTAPICFDDWDAWPGYVGGAWAWGRSWHPAPGDVRVEPVAPGQPGTAHPLVADLGAFTVTDERYCDLERHPGSVVLARSPGDDGGQDVLWAYQRRAGRTVYDALGHDARSLTHPQHAELLGRAARWATGG